MLRWMARRNKRSADAESAIGFGFRIGYWPCLRAPYVQVSFLFWHAELWHGYPSKEQIQRDDP